MGESAKLALKTVKTQLSTLFKVYDYFFQFNPF